MCSFDIIVLAEFGRKLGLYKNISLVKNDYFFWSFDIIVLDEFGRKLGLYKKYIDAFMFNRQYSDFKIWNDLKYFFLNWFEMDFIS